MSLSDYLLQLGYDGLDKGVIPDFIVRSTIRALLRQRLREIDHGSLQANHEAKMTWIEGLKQRTTIADVPEKANEQHYEVSTAFILSTLGPCAKYSACLFPTGKETLAEAEILMLESYCDKAQLRDGLDILDLGCGWGSLSLYLAKKYPNSKITGLSNSATQRKYIYETSKTRGLTNLVIHTGDVNTFDFPETTRFDRILSIEMFEHMKNYQILLKKVSTWLKTPESLLFIHIFCHRTTPYHFEEAGEDNTNWMAKNFFSGGTMPSHDLMLYFQDDLTLLRSWYLNGTHYSRTLESWLALQDKNGKAGLAELRADAKAKGLDPIEGDQAFYRFRVFYMACSELFNFNGGEEWGVGHYLFKKKAV
ncbi:S-adenosyl-L-methionine-dependent methyltransferase [Lentinula raphanica]|uniref:S-adenosyl-L-methionine-dependent methyltransferase n=1 Tax=Lentinula raphanica TaxID=153919 RepID=A0AA38P797_9AGAR|nr:S-adenosyl-L-methionine-dependent methyltransferase [Lentinula raphanica]KAJ3971566.1 S-adenosyl-L-methionine-dependent methyltransferase [Lentinula raphanica]